MESDNIIDILLRKSIYFPENITIEDAREAVKGRVDFKETATEDYVSFVYFLGMASDIFPDPETAPDDRQRRLWAIRRELRGLIFSAKDGTVISRRFHKFFNVGELPETQPEKVDMSVPFVVLEKLDGSMIAPFFSMGALRFCTKSGVTDTGDIAEEYVKKSSVPYAEFSEKWILRGWSPIYEFCSPKCRIVLEYKEESLKLLALRHNATGVYLPYAEMAKHAAEAGIPVVSVWTPPGETTSTSDAPSDTQAFLTSLTKLRDAKDVEGFVLRFESGRMYKVKTNWYFSKHHSLSFLKFAGERHVWEAILKETLDDVKPFLPDEIREAIDRFSSDLLSEISKSADRLIQAVVDARNVSKLDRKTFVATVANKHPAGAERGILMKMWDDAESQQLPVSFKKTEVVQRIVDGVLACLGSKKAMDKMKSLTASLSYETYRPKNIQMKLGDRLGIQQEAEPDDS